MSAATFRRFWRNKSKDKMWALLAGHGTGRPASGMSDRLALGPGSRSIVARHKRLGVAQREARRPDAVVVVKSGAGPARAPLGFTGVEYTGST
jgi:hypothetical protein